VAEYKWALLEKTTDTWVGWNSASGNTSVPPNSMYSNHRKGDHSKDGRTFHPSKLLWSVR